MKDGVVLVSQSYLSMIIQMANEKFLKNREKSDEFYRLLKRELLRDVEYPPREHAEGPPDAAALAEARQAGDAGSSGLWALVCHGSDCEEYRGAALAEGVLDRRRRNVKLPDGRMVSSPLEDMTPLLERAEFAENMIVPLYGEEDGAG